MEVKAHLAAIVDAFDGATMAASLDGIFTDWNKGAEKIYGYSASEAIGCHLSTLAPAGHGHELCRMAEKDPAGRGNPEFRSGADAKGRR